jgi:hypothetical protein
MSSSASVIRQWDSAIDLLDELAAHGTAQRPGTGPDLSTEDVSGGLMVCLANLPQASVATWRVLLQNEVSTNSCAGRGTFAPAVMAAAAACAVLPSVHACICKRSV